MDTSLTDIFWILICAGLVFLMQAGFTCLESGLTRSKNSINVAIKNITDFGISTMLFWPFGFALMFGITGSGWVGSTGYLFSLDNGSWSNAFFLFEIMFCATSVTIVSGATAELLDMPGTMDSQARSGDMSLHVPVEPFTEVGQIAERYNWVMDALQREAAKTEAFLHEKVLLLRETHHRVKNNLQVISSLLSLQSRYRKDEQTIEMEREGQNRIKVMALIHEKLYRSKDFANVDFNDYIKNLVNDLFASYKVSTSRIALKMDIEKIFLEIDTAIHTGLFQRM